MPFRVCGAGICCKGHQYYYFSANTEQKPPGDPLPPYAGGPRSANQPGGYEYIGPAADVLKYFAPPCKGFQWQNLH